MKKLKLIAAALAALTIGALAFADAAADNYLSKFTTLVTNAESWAKNNDGSKAATVAAQKKEIDALRQTVTLSLTQRFSDWRLTGRYDAAYTKIQAAAKTSAAKTNASSEAEKLGDALNDAANQVGGALKETSSKAVQSVKESANQAAESAKDAAKTKADETVSETANTVAGKIQQGAQAVTNALNNLLGGKKED